MTVGKTFFPKTGWQDNESFILVSFHSHIWNCNKDPYKVSCERGSWRSRLTTQNVSNLCVRKAQFRAHRTSLGYFSASKWEGDLIDSTNSRQPWWTRTSFQRKGRAVDLTDNWLGWAPLPNPAASGRWPTTGRVLFDWMFKRRRHTKGFISSFFMFHLCLSPLSAASKFARAKKSVDIIMQVPKDWGGSPSPEVIEI
jgi:hypothetical protein